MAKRKKKVDNEVDVDSTPATEEAPEKEAAEEAKPKSADGLFTVRAKQNLFMPNGEFVKCCSEKQVDGETKDKLLATKKWQLVG